MPNGDNLSGSPPSSPARLPASQHLVSMWWIFSIIFGTFFLFSIVLSIPVAFDVGGRDSGLVYSLCLFIYYIFYSFIKFITPETSRLRSPVSGLLRISQWIVIPSLLIWALGQFAVDAGNSSWVERTIAGIFRSKSTSWTEWLFGRDGVVETVMLGSWDNVLGYSGPVFQLLEGFCTLLVIQAAGQITRWLVNRGRSDTWVVSDLLFTLINSTTRALADYCRLSSWPSPAPLLLALSISCGGSPSSHKSATSMQRLSG